MCFMYLKVYNGNRNQMILRAIIGETQGEIFVSVIIRFWNLFCLSIGLMSLSHYNQLGLKLLWHGNKTFKKIGQLNTNFRHRYLFNFYISNS